MQERTAFSLPGIPMVLVLLAATLADGFWLLRGLVSSETAQVVGALLALGVFGFLWCGFFMVQPNCAAVLQLFGRYTGSCRDAGLRWTNPFYSKKSISLRVRNFESGKLKVNDIEGRPVDIAAVVVFQVHDSAEASFNVDNYEDFVHVQTEAALRQLATSYPYDLHEEHKMSLRSHSSEINAHLQREIQERLESAGVSVLEARVSHLAYAAEIAQAMLQRQQAAMVSNLLVVLCGERGTQPVVNTGTLYT